MQRFYASAGSLLSVGFTSAPVLLLLTTCWVHAQSGPTSNSTRKNKAATSDVSPISPQEVVPTPVAPESALSVEKKPPHLPAVAWDGKKLTIDADNATLADILVAVRHRTGASIDIPAAASGERVFVHLGPGPPRDVISTLLYGTPFDYIIKASDDDPDALQSVVLTAQGRDDTSSTGFVAGATDTPEGGTGAGRPLDASAHRGGETDGRTRPEGVRMMPGWASPSRPTFQADAEAALAAEQAAATEQAAAQDSAARADVAEGARASSSSPPTSDSTPDSNDQLPVEHEIQSMTKLFEQRRQIQAQQNQPSPPHSN